MQGKKTTKQNLILEWGSDMYHVLFTQLFLLNNMKSPILTDLVKNDVISGICDVIVYMSVRSNFLHSHYGIQHG